MFTSIELFSGVGGLKTGFIDTYTNVINKLILESIMDECFEQVPVYNLNKKYHPSQEELNYAEHLADLDILEQFSSLYVRNHRNYKYTSGKPDTAENVVHVMYENGIFISLSKYNNWRRSKGYRLIDLEDLYLLLDLLRITPNEFRQLIFAHIVAEREISSTDKPDGLLFLDSYIIQAQKYLLLKTLLARPPCLKNYY